MRLAKYRTMDGRVVTRPLVDEFSDDVVILTHMCDKPAADQYINSCWVGYANNPVSWGYRPDAVPEQRVVDVFGGALFRLNPDRTY